jgi:hypothetical protein
LHHATNIIFRPLVGTIGGGEFAQPPHPLAASLAALLIERGADPYQPQALYNTSLDNDDVFWLDFLYSESERRHETHKWREAAVQWPQAGMLDYLLGNAVSGNRLKRALWLLEHGAHASSINITLNVRCGPMHCCVATRKWPISCNASQPRQILSKGTMRFKSRACSWIRKPPERCRNDIPNIFSIHSPCYMPLNTISWKSRRCCSIWECLPTHTTTRIIARYTLLPATTRFESVHC